MHQHQHLQQQHLQMHQQQHMIPPQRMSSGQLPVTSTMHPSESGDGVIMIEQVPFTALWINRQSSIF